MHIAVEGRGSARVRTRNRARNGRQFNTVQLLNN